MFDASVKVEDNPSLNDKLYKGPCLLPKLFDLLLVFRAKPIALTGDIENAFLQIARFNSIDLVNNSMYWKGLKFLHCYFEEVLTTGKMLISLI